jgi:hypothetical protein
MRYLGLFMALTSFVIVATHVSAQTPDTTATPEPTELAAPSLTPAPTPTPVIVAAPDEIVFTGELAVPAGTTVRALFGGLYIIRDHECARTTTERTTGQDGSAFILRVPASCAGEAGPTICWSETGCYAHVADHRECDFRGNCPWSDTIAPGKVVELGAIPIAAADEVVFVGEIPVPAGSTITVKMLSADARAIVDCATATTTTSHDDGTSAFVLRTQADCIRQGFPPLFCWGDGICGGFEEQTIVSYSVVPGTTVGVGLLQDRNGPNAPATPLPHIPNVGGYQAGPSQAMPSWLTGVLAALFAMALALGASGLVLRLRVPLSCPRRTQVEDGDHHQRRKGE